MSIGNLNTQGGKKNNFTYQLGVLELLQNIVNNTTSSAGADYELVNTDYQAIANGVGYSIGDSITRTIIISVPTGTVATTVWWNNTTGLQISPAPSYVVLQQVAAPTSITVTNGAGALAVNIQDGGNSITVDNANLNAPISNLNLEATQLLIKALFTAIDGDTSNLDVLLSTRASEATLLNVLTTADFQARINTLGQKTSANSTPVVLASDQSSIPVTLSGSVPVTQSTSPWVMSAASLPLPTGAATEVTLALIKAKTDNLDVALSTRASTALQTTGNNSVASIDTKTPALGQATAAASIPVVLTAAQITTLTPPAAITGFATEATLATRLSESDFDIKTGSLTETAPGTDTASSGLNGRLQRIAQRLTSLLSIFPTALGQTTMANSLAVTIASNQSTLNTTTLDVSATGNITTQNLNPNTGAATAGSTISLTSLSGRATVSIQVSGIYTGALTAQVTVDNVNWVNLNSIQNVSAGLMSTTIPSATVGIFQTDGSGFVGFRISANSAVTGTAVVTINANSTPTIITLDNSIGQVAAANSLSVALPNEQIQDLFITGQGTQTVLNNNILLATAGTTSTDVLALNSSYRSFYCQINGTAGIAGGAVFFEGSNDNVNFSPVVVYDLSATTGVPINTAITISASTFRFFAGKATFRYLRCRISTVFTGGSVQAFTKFTPVDYVPQIMTVAQATAANLNTTAIIASGTVTTVSTVTSLTTLANGQTAHSSASTGSPIRIGGRVAPTTIATVDATLVAGDASDAAISTGQQLITKSFSVSELDYTSTVLPSVTSTAIQSIVAASGTASVRNYITQISVQTDTLGAAGNMFILDNQGAIGTSVTNATPGVFTSTAHDLKIGDVIIFTAIGTITGISVNTMYYITGTTLAATTFTIALTPGGAAIAITGSTSAFTFYRVFNIIRLNTAALTTSIVITPINPYKGIANANLNVYLPTSLVTGTIYLNVNGYKGF